MDITLQDVANIVTLVAPGYFASKTYSLIYAKNQKELGRTILESAVFSLPIVAVYDYSWRLLADNESVVIATSVNYVIPLLLFSILVGWIFAKARSIAAVKRAARHAGLPSADRDFLRAQFRKLGTKEPVTVTLRSDEVFSGTPQGGSVFEDGLPRFYYFNNVAWFDDASGKWQERPGSIILELAEARYIETAKKLPRD